MENVKVLLAYMASFFHVKHYGYSVVFWDFCTFPCYWVPLYWKYNVTTAFRTDLDYVCASQFETVAYFVQGQNWTFSS